MSLDWVSGCVVEGTHKMVKDRGLGRKALKKQGAWKLKTSKDRGMRGFGLGFMAHGLGLGMRTFQAKDNDGRICRRSCRKSCSVSTWPSV